MGVQFWYIYIIPFNRHDKNNFGAFLNIIYGIYQGLEL